MELRKKFNHPPLPLLRNDRVLHAVTDQDVLTADFTSEAVEFIRRNQARPFFIYLPHIAMHVPLHPVEEDRRHFLAAPNHFGQLRQIGAGARHDAAGEHRHMVADGVQERDEPVQFGPAQPHVDLGPFLGRGPEQRGIGTGLVQIPADRDRLGDHGAVVQFQERNAVERVHRGVGLGELVVLADIQFLDQNVDPGLGQIDADPLGIRRRAEIVEFHGAPPPVDPV